MNNKKVFFLLSFFFFFSGVCALIYEVVWLKLLGLVFGNTTLAMSTVLAVFMGGLGLGSIFFGKKIDSSKAHPLRWYGMLELGIGIFCLFTFPLIGMIRAGYIWCYQVLQPNFITFSLIRFFLSFIILFIPTFCMGGTLPIVISWFQRSRRVMVRDVGWFYGINTVGACCGVLFSSFYMLYHWGLPATLYVAAAGNCCIGVLSLITAKKVSAQQEDVSHPEAVACFKDHSFAPPEHEGRFSRKTLMRLLLIGFGLSGFASMAYEICWTKTLALALGSSVYSFAIMLSTFLAGIGLGSLIIARLAKKIDMSFILFGTVQLAIALSALVGLFFVEDLPYYFLNLYRMVGHAHGFLTLGKSVLSSLLMLMPTVCIGMTFPLVTHLIRREKDATGSSIGLAYGVNTIGTITGSFCGGFILIPLFGIQTTFKIAIAINAFIGLVMVVGAIKTFSMKKTLVPMSIAGVCLFLFMHITPWSESLLTANVAINPLRYEQADTKKELLDIVTQSELLYYKEGLSGVVSVKRNQAEHLFLSVNANIDASTGDMFTQLFSGYLPMLLADNPQKALIIGMGSGVTAAAVASFDIPEIHCVELEGAVTEAARFFTKENRSVLDDKRLTVFTNDGRNHLMARNDTYDVIISEPSSPWMSGVASLFTQEQFTLMKARLNPGGVVCQWFNTYSMSTDDIRMIMNTFSSVFEHVELWHTNAQDFFLIASPEPIDYDFERVNKRILTNQLVREDLSQFAIYNAAGMLSCFLLTGDELRAMSEGARLNRDNYPRLEYSAPRNMYQYQEMMRQNRALIDTYRNARYPTIINMPHDATSTVIIHNAIARAYIEKSFYPDAVYEIGLSNNLSEGNPGAQFNFGLVQLAAGRPTEALNYLTAFASAIPRSAEVYYHIGRAYEALEQFANARDSYQHAMILEGSNTDYRCAYADACARTGEYDTAVQVLESVIMAEGLLPRTGIKLAAMYLSTGQVEVATKVLFATLKQYPGVRVLYEKLGMIYERTDDRDRALRVYHQAVKKFPHYGRLYKRMADIYQTQSLTYMEKLYRDKAKEYGY